MLNSSRAQDTADINHIWLCFRLQLTVSGIPLCVSTNVVLEVQRFWKHICKHYARQMMCWEQWWHQTSLFRSGPDRKFQCSSVSPAPTKAGCGTSPGCSGNSPCVFEFQMPFCVAAEARCWPTPTRASGSSSMTPWWRSLRWPMPPWSRSALVASTRPRSLTPVSIDCCLWYLTPKSTDIGLWLQ